MKGFFFHQGRRGCEGRVFGHRDGFGRGFGGPFRGGPFRGREGGSFSGRGFGHGGLRLVLLKMISEKPSHGYELIKAIEERAQGAYSPSPGVIYPTLSWLEDEDYITIVAGDDGRKLATITEAGRAYLAEKAETVDELFSAMDGDGAETGRHGNYATVFRAMHNLKAAMKMRGLRPMSQADIDQVVDMIDELARKIERS